MFKAILIEREGEKGQKASLADLDEGRLPAGDVMVRVEHSTLNYKDALAITGKSPIIRAFPMVPGVDLAGTVETSEHAGFAPGDKVLLDGWGVGEKHFGGLAQKARMNGDWLIPVPGALTTRQAMAIGTAGYTAMLSVLALEKHGLTPPARGGADAPVLVTGANGGVGGFAIAILAGLGYSVAASTGRPEEADYLKKLGASEVIDRKELGSAGKPLGKERWAAAIDSVGSHTLANACAGIRYGGAVAACGLAQGMDFPATVAPFILRGVSLLGIDSVMRPKADRVAAWDRLASAVGPASIELIARDIGLAEVLSVAADLLEGKVRGRVVVDVNA